MIKRDKPEQQWAEVDIGREDLIPLFLVYSSDTIGLGDCFDLKLLIDRMARENSKILHLLPVNEMGSDFNPYEPLSLFSLEPFHIRLQAISGASGPFKNRIEELSYRFPCGSKNVDFDFKEKKFNLLWDMYEEECQSGTLDGGGLSAFVDENIAWLPDYAMFKVLRDSQGKRPWQEWDVQYRDRDREALEMFTREHEKELIFDYWVQMHAYRQFRKAKEYASSRGIMIKGELPLHVPVNCADVWAHPSFFSKPERQRVQQISPSYLRERIRFMSNLFHIISIDSAMNMSELLRIAQGANVLFTKETAVAASLAREEAGSNRSFIRFWLTKGLIRLD